MVYAVDFFRIDMSTRRQGVEEANGKQETDPVYLYGENTENRVAI
jgi:hypothetical protein